MFYRNYVKHISVYNQRYISLNKSQQYKYIKSSYAKNTTNLILSRRSIIFQTFDKITNNNNKYISNIHYFMIKPRKYLYNSSFSHILGHTSFIFLACSYTVTDMLLLRSFAIFGGLNSMAYAYWHPFKNKLFLPFSWNLIFLIVNMFHIFKLYYERYCANHMTNEEKQIFDNIFSSCELDQVYFHKLIKSGEFINIDKDVYLTQQGINNPYVYLMVNGSADVSINSKKIYEINNNQFIGELGIICGLKITDTIKSSASVKSNNKIRVIRWSRGKLIDILEENHDLLLAFQYCISTDLISKLLNNKTNNDINLSQKYINQYESLLEKIFENDIITSHERNILKKYRQLHGISKQSHIDSLAKFKWSIIEFNHGIKN